MKRFGVWVWAIILFVAVAFAIREAQAQTVIPWTRIQQDAQGYYIQCEQYCDVFNTLGTPEELNVRMPEMHCAINWYYMLVNRGLRTSLQFLVGPNGDQSNPLCGRVL